MEPEAGRQKTEDRSQVVELRTSDFGLRTSDFQTMSFNTTTD